MRFRPSRSFTFAVNRVARERIMTKLNPHDVGKLTRYAIRNGIAPLD